MICRTCGNQEAHVLRTRFEGGEPIDQCNACSPITPPAAVGLKDQTEVVLHRQYKSMPKTLDRMIQTHRAEVAQNEKRNPKRL